MKGLWVDRKMEMQRGPGAVSFYGEEPRASETEVNEGNRTSDASHNTVSSGFTRDCHITMAANHRAGNHRAGNFKQQQWAGTSQ
jgi:hypothetical protein